MDKCAGAARSLAPRDIATCQAKQWKARLLWSCPSYQRNWRIHPTTDIVIAPNNNIIIMLVDWPLLAQNRQAGGLHKGRSQKGTIWHPGAFIRVQRDKWLKCGTALNMSAQFYTGSVSESDPKIAVFRSFTAMFSLVLNSENAN